MIQKGLIMKAISGFYYVETADGLLECKAKGVFRKKGITPLVGDMAEVEDNTVVNILPRKNELLRPPAANLDQALMVVSAQSPDPNLMVLDKLIAVCEYKDIEPVLVVTKTDLCNGEWLCELYRSAGFTVVSTSVDVDNVEEIRGLLKDKLTLFIGNTGVGKSTLLNRLFPELNLATAEISEKLGRGRHTTRHVELYPLPEGGFVADTPGFSTVELSQYDRILKGDLQHCFREFQDYLGDCKFLDCSHRVEKGCAVLEAIHEGKINVSRHESYCALYEDAMKIKEWEK
ncbi:ribosome small subunit-dependent GTPase A [Clostridiaceae bacterium NSJ-33]|uniref:Small ribosomal subunit biogenesis GTPase RsgA n=2 Tax=Fumia xinanensis TaxID=2763659 RepID=A0A926I1X1_9FIRM|nr:ribosome small subunit-dependent GTPase A [Fumia xinanensis]PWL46682.1 MAG: ribosome small subunit-dependent GTPase A [Clostridiales bacterium]